MTVLPTSRVPEPVVAASGVPRPVAASELDRLADLRTSAQGWHRAQLAVPAPAISASNWSVTVVGCARDWCSPSSP